MNYAIGCEKEVVLTTRDFCAVSYAKDGTDFRVSLRGFRGAGRENDIVTMWFDDHRFDNYRIAFKPDEPEDYLQCHDETEALSIILALQRELNEAMT